jgi:RNA polymerase sigma-70 factor (ECF subfamily)
MEFISNGVDGRNLMSTCQYVRELNYSVEPEPVAAATARLEPISEDASPARPKRNPKPDEAELVRRLKTGDELALKAIFNLYSAKLYSVAHRILGEVADSEEVVQDVFWTAYRKAHSFRGNSQLSTWLYRLTVNAALGRIRRGKKWKEVEYDEYLPKFEKDGHHAVRPVVDWSDTLDERYAKEEIQQLLSEALDQLKPVDKSIIVLSDLEGMSDKEIALTVGLTVSAVKTRLHRARLFLRGKLAVHLGHSPS